MGDVILDFPDKVEHNWTWMAESRAGVTVDAIKQTNKLVYGLIYSLSISTYTLSIDVEKFLLESSPDGNPTANRATWSLSFACEGYADSRLRCLHP